MPEDNAPSVKEALQKCFETGEYADMTITCSGRTWQVHKVVVCSQVPFFAKAVTGKFKEARNSCIDLVGDDPSTVDVMLRWLYYGTLHFQECWPSDMCGTRFLARCYKIADKYLLADLRTSASQKLRSTLMDSNWSEEDVLALVASLSAGADEQSKAAP
ncbi:hypothetical protein KC343_g4886 [Hortaea werneckii]|nr:hypothetical protein KC323_g7686 [Hortaea werneckii]KAI6857401.1 hypothetical protein KC338_g8111 [Hortaea werneckii]KAI7153496.1 hypothetical protein KC352_g27924 [Hortaea werneckii]KAI7346318.1 hypothetical protein KC320_g7937 [Hortaea werneckii]KAI7567728.1 hypothetical protein KC317_g4784 [Hortaea werneckii]